MAFIKRSTITPTNVKVGKKMLKCSSCDKLFVSKIPANLCQNCASRTVSLDEDHPEDIPDFDLDQE